MHITVSHTEGGVEGSEISYPPTQLSRSMDSEICTCYSTCNCMLGNTGPSRALFSLHCSLLRHTRVVVLDLPFMWEGKYLKWTQTPPNHTHSLHFDFCQRTMYLNMYLSWELTTAPRLISTLAASTRPLDSALPAHSAMRALYWSATIKLPHDIHVRVLWKVPYLCGGHRAHPNYSGMNFVTTS